MTAVVWLVAVPLAGLLWVEAGRASAHGRPVWAGVLATLAAAVAATLAAERALAVRHGGRR